MSQSNIPEILDRLNSIESLLESRKETKPISSRVVSGLFRFFWARMLMTGLVSAGIALSAYAGVLKAPSVTKVSHSVISYDTTKKLLIVDENGAEKRYTLSDNGWLDLEDFEPAYNNYLSRVENYILIGNFGPDNPWPTKESFNWSLGW